MVAATDRKEVSYMNDFSMNDQHISIHSQRSWVEIKLSTLYSNLQIYSSHLPITTQIMAVVKADAYGHGDRVVAKYLSDNGVRHFAVSNIDEAIHIRAEGVTGQIMILGYTPIERAGELIEYDVIQTLLSEEYAEALAATGLPVKCQFAIDTGMRRIGLNADNPDYCEQVIREYSHRLDLNGLFTHLCVADVPEQNGFSVKQIGLFEEVSARVSDMNLSCHCMNSAGGLWHNSNSSCFARLGIILYGLKPNYLNTLPEGIKTVLSWKSVVSMVKSVQPGDTIGYGRSYTVDRPMTIATIPTGYADGYPRLLSNKGYVLINGKKADIVGCVCMDQMMVDVTDIPDVRFESEVVLIGESGDEIITADDLANMIGTIGYEIVCGISKRVDRVYQDK